ncbi:hypothetical protein [Cellulomonas sp. P5_C5]
MSQAEGIITRQLLGAKESGTQVGIRTASGDSHLGRIVSVAGGLVWVQLENYPDTHYALVLRLDSIESHRLVGVAPEETPGEREPDVFDTLG